MSFKLKYKDRTGVEIEMDFEMVEFDVSGNFIVTGEDKITGETHRFVWKSADYDPTPEDFPPGNPD
jgi:hypothetical protein